MSETGTILTINPGSTSTKLTIFSYALRTSDLKMKTDQNLLAAPSDLPLLDQLDMRLKQVHNFLTENHTTPDMIMSRGAPLRPLEGGTYEVNQAMIEDIRSLQYADHASNLGPVLGRSLADQFHIPVYIADPITTDEFEEVARISGVPEISRRSRSHALNIKACTRRVCQEGGLDLHDSAWVVAHLGGGISIAALKNGRIIDVNDALLGMGPFSPERAGALPIEGLLDLVSSGDQAVADIKAKLSRESGLKAYLGTSDLKIIEQRIVKGDPEASLIVEAMLYQISKEMAAMASTFQFELNGFILTGGMAHSSRICTPLIETFSKLAPVFVQAGENEGLALGEAGLRILQGIESPKIYTKDTRR